MPQRHPNRLRSEEWLNNPDNPGMTALYVERCGEFLRAPPPPDWHGVYRMTTK